MLRQIAIALLVMLAAAESHAQELPPDRPINSSSMSRPAAAST